MSINTSNKTSLQLDTASRLASDAAKQDSDGALLAATVAAVQWAGARMAERFNPGVRTPDTLQDVVKAIHANDDASLLAMRGLLQQARPQAGWVEDELEGGALPDGEWWIVDPVEGNINHVQGMTEWGISATLARNNLPVLTAVYQPLADRLFTAMRGTGVAYMNGRPMRPSTKSELRAAILTTGQAKPGESSETYRRLGQSITAMLHAALVVRMTVPATFQLGLVASGNIDGFWQFSDVRSGLAAGALLVAEAGGHVTDMQGRPWTLASPNFLACAPGVHPQALDVLRRID